MVPDHETDILLCLDRCIATGRGGDIREVTRDEYEGWAKNSAGLPRVYKPERESFGGSVPTPTSSVKGTSNVRSSSPPGEVEVAVPAAVAESKPAAQPGPAVPTTRATPVIPTRKQGAPPPAPAA